jgi:glycosyltransferase involved in cell wall biosynthesis
MVKRDSFTISHIGPPPRTIHNGSIMRYPIFDIEVTRPISDLTLSPEDAGVAVLVRRKGVPIGFWIDKVNGERLVPACDLARRIAMEASKKILAEAIQEEIMHSSPLASLPLVTIAICTKDRPKGVERLLLSLHEQASALPKGSAGLEILLVDNAPSDESTRGLALQRPEVRYVREQRPGLNFARNRALREARGEILAFLDDDVVVDKYWSAGLASAWGENSDAGAFTGQVLPLELETEAQVIFEKHGGFRRGFDRVRYGRSLPGNSLYPGGAGSFGAGANMAFRTEVLRRVGGFDEALDTGAAVPGGGDLDIFYRIIRAGHTLVYEPRFLVFHQHRREMKALRVQLRRSWGLGFMCYICKCFASDPERRGNLIRLIVWWFVNETTTLLMHVKKKVLRKAYIPPTIFLGELWGGVVGLLGGYSRSKRRLEEIRKMFP